jgi:opacity protein-like surface antigen
MGVALAWAGAAGAADLRLSLGASSEYDTNVYRRDKNDGVPGAIEDDFVISGIPELQLLETEGKLTYEVGYEFPYQRSIDTDALRGFNHGARIGTDYHMNDATRFSFSDRFSYQQSLNTQFDDTPEVQSTDERQHIFRNRLSLGAHHRWSPRLGSNLRFDQQLFYTDQQDRSDNQSYTLTGDLEHMLTERHTISGGLQGTYQHFKESGNDPESDSYFIGPFVGWSYRIDEQSNFRISVGPSWVHSKSDDFDAAPPGLDCTQTPPNQNDQCSSDDDRIAVFGEAVIDRRWSPTMASALSYRRNQDTASGVSGSAILDAVALTHTWALTERWSLAGRADWTQRKSATDVQEGIDDLDTQRWGAGTVLSYAITRNLTGSARYQYNQQESKGGSAGRNTDFNAHIVTLGIQYSLDPIEVW